MGKRERGQTIQLVGCAYNKRWDEVPGRGQVGSPLTVLVRKARAGRDNDLSRPRPDLMIYTGPAAPSNKTWGGRSR